MAGVACKIIINQLIRALSKSLERILSNPLIRDSDKISASEADALLDRLVHLDLDAADGAGSAGTDGLLAIVADLVRRGIVTDEVWRVLKNPA